MAKVATKYLTVHPWKIKEDGFHFERNQVSESIFSLANEFMGVRGFLEEGSSALSLQGCYYNGIYEWGEKTYQGYKGIVKRSHYLVNGLNWLKTTLKVNGEKLDIAKERIDSFQRVLDLKTGTLTRSFILNTDSGKIDFTFIRFLSMLNCNRGYQRILIKSDHPVNLELDFALDFNTKHWGKMGLWEAEMKANKDYLLAVGKTQTTNQYLAGALKLDASKPIASEVIQSDKEIGYRYRFTLEGEIRFDRSVSVFVDKAGKKKTETIAKATTDLKASDFEVDLKKNRSYWKSFWEESDVVIEGDLENQQGIRYCIFQLQQTYHGFDPYNNIGAKGLTGEAYSGHAFWDTETYCLPYYLYNNLPAARDLLLFRYHTLPEARMRAKELDSDGACYPIATLNGYEACTLWQHASLQLQPSTAVAYAIFHYFQVAADFSFLVDYGLEMLLEISRFLLSRGQWNQDKTYFGYYCVMGPDEFQMMVNHNTYTNYMAKKTFLYTLAISKEVEEKAQESYLKILEKVGISEGFFQDIKNAAEKMKILYDSKSELFEQHQGYFDLPHIDIHSIPVTDFPLYHNWSYDRIYRNDMIKQPDVLMFLFLYNQDFTLSVKKANYEFYEPRCIHESSLSPSVHSILAAEIGKSEEALSFFGFATRLDLDDYNRNTNEGLHLTSIAAAWMNIVYGFGGLRSDGEILVLNPTIPPIWKHYSFKIKYQNKNLKVSVSKEQIKITSDNEKPLPLLLFGKKIILTDEYLLEREKV